MDLNSLRKLFPVTRNYIFLNHAGTSPVSTRVRDAMVAQIQDMVDYGGAGLPKWYRLCLELKAKFGAWIGAQADEIALTLNTSEGINIVADGLDWRPGDNVVLPNIEYPANVYPWMNLRDRGVETRLVPDIQGTFPVEQFERFIDHRTRVLAVSFVQFASGYTADLEALGQLCQQRNIRFVVDGIQGIGVLPINVKKAQIDFLSTSTYKWMLGPQGAGLFYIDRQRLDEVKPRWVGSQSVINPEDYLNYNLTFQPTAGRFEPGTHATVCFAGAHAALELLLELGLDFIRSRIFELTDFLYEKALAAGYEVYSPWKPQERSGIISISKPGVDPERVRQILLKEKIVATVRGGRLRLAPHCYNTLEEMNKVANLLP